MKPAFRKRGLGSIAAMCLLLGAIIGVSTIEDTHADDPQAWHRVDKSKLFLHDLTSQGATFVTALRIDEDGEVSGDIADLYELRFGHSEKGVDAHRSTLIVEPETEIDKAILFNPAEYSVMAYMQVGQTIRELRLFSGEGVAVGEPSTFMKSEQQRGCRCICSGVHPETGEQVQETIFVACREVVAQAKDGEPCDCSGINDQNCWPANRVHPEFDGKTRDCGAGFIPASKHRHR